MFMWVLEHEDHQLRTCELDNSAAIRSIRIEQEQRKPYELYIGDVYTGVIKAICDLTTLFQRECDEIIR